MQPPMMESHPLLLEMQGLETRQILRLEGAVKAAGPAPSAAARSLVRKTQMGIAGQTADGMQTLTRVLLIECKACNRGGNYRVIIADTC